MGERVVVMASGAQRRRARGGSCGAAVGVMASGAGARWRARGGSIGAAVAAPVFGAGAVCARLWLE